MALRKPGDPNGSTCEGPFSNELLAKLKDKHPQRIFEVFLDGRPSFLPTDIDSVTVEKAIKSCPHLSPG